MKTVVIKFGGTSVSTKDRLYTICEIVKKEKEINPVVVVSAIRGVTDVLFSLAMHSQDEKKQFAYIRSLHETLIKDIWQDANFKEMMQYIDTVLSKINTLVEKRKDNKAFLDKIVSYGEIMSSFIISRILNEKGIKSKQILATDIIVTDNNFGSAEFLVLPTKEKVKKVIAPLITKGVVPVITGFIGATEKGEVTTLGRGGSDYTASIIGFCLDANEVQIWTDVDGIYTADPRMVKKAKLISEISYREASEMAFFGAKVLHPRTIRPAIKGDIPVRVLNTLHPEHPGTLINNNTSSFAIAAVTCKKRVTLINIYAAEMFLSKGFLSQIFDVFAKQNISLDLVSASEVSISVTLDNDDNLDKVVEILKTFSRVTIAKDVGTVSLIGEGIKKDQGIIFTTVSLLNKENIAIKMISFDVTTINMSFVIDAKEVERAVQILHNRLLLKSN